MQIFLMLPVYFAIQIAGANSETDEGKGKIDLMQTENYANYRQMEMVMKHNVATIIARA